jgi:menaquinone C8-methyltransferase
VREEAVIMSATRAAARTRHPLGRLDAADVLDAFDEPVGAYLHIPFCSWICPFCPYNKVRARDDLAQRYFADLRAEVTGYLAAAARAGRLPFTSLYVGGGTPTLYPDELAAIVERLPVSGERAIEVLPTHATPQRLDQLRAMGFTAVSIGAQSFHDPVLRTLHRPHDARTAREAVVSAQRRFDCVDVDLIVDVAWDRDPELAEAFEQDALTCFELGVAQVSTYPLMRFGYTPFGRAHHDRRREHAVLRQVERLAARHGYRRQSVWTFNRVGAAPYTSITRRRFLGMGAGASTYAGRDFFVNHFGLEQYHASLAAGRLPVARRLHLGRWFGAGYDAFWQAYAGRVDLGALQRSYGGDVSAVAGAALQLPRWLGLLEPCPGGFALTPSGFDVYHDLERLVTYELIEPLWGQMLAEHEGSGLSQDHGGWATPAHAREGRLFGVASRWFERGPVGSGRVRRGGARRTRDGRGDARAA